MKSTDKSDDEFDAELDQEFVVTNIDGFMAAIIKFFNDVYEWSVLDYLTPAQCKSIFLQEYSVCAESDIITTPRCVDALLDEFKRLCISGIISSMAAQNLIDVAWDDNANDFVFKLTPEMLEQLQKIKAQQK